ncbi:DUF2325 domain-containing protein [Clostridium sporogenes]|uniref:DUF2325 domain-containing protein n=1 Tax=Clostridium sporogenes TaxID=1509 RepID=UPI0013D486D9|nr:DUF2325 domain-containing protein [Clostridium sporogenes]NFF75986.1 DUF2325 domain-containing protein [Clostridium sporogenes]NFH40884.1 DUF2325 domain-containing protein [Clostridium sporogenes]
MELDLLPFIAEALSTNKRTYKDIDKIYNEDKLKFIKLAKHNKFYNYTMSQEGSVEQEYYFKKALGILEGANIDEDILEKLLLILKKGWKYTYTYIQNHNQIIPCIFLNRFVKKHKNIDNLSDDEFNSNFIVLLILSNYFEKEIDSEDEMYKNYIRSCAMRLEHYKNINRINLNNITREQKEVINKLELKLKAHKKISATIPSSYRLDQDKYNGLLVDINKLTKEDKAFTPFEYIGDLENISLISIVGNDFFKQRDIQELIYTYSQFQTKDTINYNEFLKYIYPAIQIRYLFREYKKAKKYFFENFDEELFEEINKKDMENKEIKKTNILLQDENERLKLELEKLEKENKQLKQELHERENYKSEVVSLREFIFNLDDVEDFQKEQIEYDKLNSLNAIIIGGHAQWQNKMKEYLPNCKFISPDMLNFDTNILNNVDIVFIYTNYLNHAMYYKVIDIIRENKLRLEYLKSNINMEIVLKEINKVL